MKRIIEGLPLAVAAVWLLVPWVVSATRPSARGALSSPSSLAPPSASPSMPTVVGTPRTAMPIAPLVDVVAAPLEITVGTVLVEGRAPPSPASFAPPVPSDAPARAWRCGAWRSLASGPVTQTVRDCQ